MRGLARSIVLSFLLAPLVLAQERSPYAVRPSDILEVIVVGQASLSGDFAVGADSSIDFPLLGKVRAQGMTAPEIQAKIQRDLSNGFLKRPEVSVRVKEFRSQPVMVVGEVPKPGLYPLKGDRSLLSLLAEVGGLTGNAGHEIVVARPPEGLAPVAVERFVLNPVVPGLNEAAGSRGASELPPGALEGSDVFRASCKELQRGNESLNILLEGGDMVFVPKAALVHASGQVMKAGSYRFEEGMTVLDLLLAAGGVSERGSQKRLKLIRFENGKRREIKAKVDDLVKPGDTLLVGERFF